MNLNLQGQKNSFVNIIAFVGFNIQEPIIIYNCKTTRKLSLFSTNMGFIESATIQYGKQ